MDYLNEDFVSKLADIEGAKNDQKEMKGETVQEQWLSFKKDLDLTREKKRRDTIADETERARIELSLALSTAELEKYKKLIEIEECQVDLQNMYLECAIKNHQDTLNKNKIRSDDAWTGIEKARSTMLELDAMIEKLTREKRTLESELDNIGGTLRHFTHCNEIMSKMAPHPVTAPANEKHFAFNTTEKYRPALHFSTPQELLEVMAELTEQNLSLIQNSTKLDETLEELNQCIENTTTKTKEVEDKLTSQILDMEDKVDKEKTGATKLKHAVVLHDLKLKTTDEDLMLKSLGAKVSKTHGQCVDKPLTTLSTLEMLGDIESRMYGLLEQLETIPDDFVDGVMKLKESEKRGRQQMEQLRLEREKQKERQKKCIERSLGETKKKVGRKLMPRCIAVETKAKDEDENKVTDEGELEAFLFGTEDNE